MENGPFIDDLPIQKDISIAMLDFQRVPSNFSAPNSWRAIQNTFHQGFVGVEYTQFRDGFNPTPFWSRDDFWRRDEL